MSYVEVPGAKVPIRMWTDPAAVEDVALQQLQNVATLPWIKGLAVMSDVYYGKGATVGSVIAMHVMAPRMVAPTATAALASSASA